MTATGWRQSAGERDREAAAADRQQAAIERAQRPAAANPD
jgi:hypothetical protein